MPSNKNNNHQTYIDIEVQTDLHPIGRHLKNGEWKCKTKKGIQNIMGIWNKKINTLTDK